MDAQKSKKEPFIKSEIVEKNHTENISYKNVLLLSHVLLWIFFLLEVNLPDVHQRQAIVKYGLTVDLEHIKKLLRLLKLILLTLQ